MEILRNVSMIIADLGVIIAIVIPVFVKLKKLNEAAKCQLRTEMLRTYYKHVEEKSIRQYEFENFEKNYVAYKALKGNGFADKTWKEIQEWKVIS